MGDFTEKNYIFREIKIFVKLISQKKIIVLPKIKNGDQDMATYSTILIYSILILRIGIFSYWIANRFLTPTAVFFYQKV